MTIFDFICKIEFLINNCISRS